MAITSKATRNIAFSVKSNAIPRVTAVPPYGIIKAKEKQLIAVSIQVGYKIVILKILCLF